MNSLDKLSIDQRNGLLLLCLLTDKFNLFHLAELLGSNETVDELLQLPHTQSDDTEIWLEQEARNAIQGNFKWSEKVRAAEKLATYFYEKSISAETTGDLWLMAGKKEKACQAFEQAFEQYEQEQSLKPTMRTGEKLMKLDSLPEEAKIKVLKKLVECYECCGQLHDAILARKKLLEEPQIINNKEEHAFLLRALAIDYGKQGSWSHYKKQREAAAYLFREISKYQDAAIEFLALTNRGIDEINIIVGLQCADEGLKDANRSEKIELVCKAQSMKAYLKAMSGEVEIAHNLAEEALETALKNNLPETAAYCYRKLAGTYEYASNYSMAKTVYIQAAGFCDAQNIDSQTQFCYSCLTWVLFRIGEWKKAIEVSNSLINDPSVNNPSKATAYCVIAFIKSLRGEIRPAEKHAREGIILAQKEQFLLIQHLFYLPMANINELKGELEIAREWYEKIIDEWHITNENHDVVLSIMGSAIFFLKQNNHDGLKKCLEILSTIGKVTDNPEVIGSMAYVLGLNAMLNNLNDVALEHLMKARKYLEPLNIPYQLILVDFQISQCLLLQNKTDTAREQLQELLLRTKKYGLAPLSSKITSSINQITLEKPFSEAILTERQLDVLRLLSKGISNKEIASELFLSPRTVDMHMRNLFDRLGCNSRWDAVEKGRSLGLI